MSAHIAAILLALSSLESGDNDNAIGKHGERSRYQITEATWIRFAPKGFDFVRDSKDQKKSTKVAVNFISHDRIVFVAFYHREPTPQEIYKLWNPRAPKETCERFANLVKEFEKGKK